VGQDDPSVYFDANEENVATADNAQQLNNNISDGSQHDKVLLSSQYFLAFDQHEA
jgi:hypothetical protein